MLKFNLMKYDKVTDDKGVGGGGGSETKPPETIEAPGDSLDDFGYEKITPLVEPPKEGTPAAKPGEKAPEPKLEEIKDPSTGYGVIPPVVPEVPPTPPAKVELPFELEIKDLDVVELNKVKEFVKAHNLPKEVAEALANQKKSEIDAVKAADEAWIKGEETRLAKMKVDWDKELRTHPTFGGEKFAQNIHNVEKVLNDFFPETKKILTERKSMLPPHTMRDFAKLAERLYSPENLVQGDKIVTEEKPYDPLDFYNEN